MGSIYFTAFLLLFWDLSEIGKNVILIASAGGNEHRSGSFYKAPPLTSRWLEKFQMVSKIACITTAYIILCLCCIQY